MEASAFEILMESVLKMASLMDVSVFVLVENRNNQRRYGGSNHLCDMYCNGRLEGENDDVRLRVEGPTTDLRSVQRRREEVVEEGEEETQESWMSEGASIIRRQVGKRRGDVQFGHSKKSRTGSGSGPGGGADEELYQGGEEAESALNNDTSSYSNQVSFAEISGYYDEQQATTYGEEYEQPASEGEEWNENSEEPPTPRRTSRRTRKLRSVDFNEEYQEPQQELARGGKQRFKKKTLNQWDQPVEEAVQNQTVSNPEVQEQDSQQWALVPVTTDVSVLDTSTAKSAPNLMPYMCSSDECATKANTYYKSKDLKDHIVTHHGKEMFFDCDSCHTQSLRFKDMKTHLKQSHGITQTFICFICYRGFIAGTLYHKHWDEYHDRSCRFCYITLATLEELKDHLVIVHQKVYDQTKPLAGAARNAPYLCKLEECGLTFHQQQQLYGHIRNNHGKNIRFYCSICQESQVGLAFTEIRTHLIADHGAKVSFLCYVDGCFRAFKDKELYLEHKKLEHAYECRYCLTCFPQDDALQEHIKLVHSILDEGGLTCRKCGMLCVDNYKLKVHQQRCWR